MKYYVEDNENGTLLASNDGGRRDKQPLVVNAITSKLAKQTGGPAGDEGNHLIAAPLSHGSNPNSNMAGRRREDDENLVVSDSLLGHRGKGGGGIAPDETLVATAFHMLQDPISDESVTPAWGKGAQHGAASIGVSNALGVRRLTPIECERLQALPDDWTLVPEGAPDSRRYAALGDAVTASVSEWIGRRLMEIG